MDAAATIRGFSRVPLLGWLVGAFVAVVLEIVVGTPLAVSLGLSKIPVLFGVVTALKQPLLFPGAAVYVLLVYAVPIAVIARFTTGPANWVAGRLLAFPLVVSAAVHLGLFYITLEMWSGLSDYRDLVLRFTLIAVMVTLSLNVINGYMGEFSCSHPGFMAVGAYVASVLSVDLFTKHRVFGEALLPPALGPFLFPVVLIIAGLVAAVSALVVAIPSFRTRGDYLAIISLAFMFIVKSLIENLEIVGGARGLGGQPDWAGLPTVFLWTVACVWVINNFVRSTLGKAVNAVRDNEMAATAMTVDTRYTKMVGFLFAAFWAGVAGGLFAHVLRYVNPGTFGIQKLAEVLAMVYFGGLNSVYGSIIGAVGISLLGEALRPLEIFKWIIIPLLLILVMIYRPTGLVAFKEFDPETILKPKSDPERERDALPQG
ncbi:MAG: branched-chain amino acid ABC transporter permease [Deltaproteobacteria bacterium]|nr:branched-chain amino acid ABC transporter permease [Deltaproteobacteria bacterium]